MREFPYLPTHPNHPCAIWVRASLDNFHWTHCYANALNDEYWYRYGRQHKSVVEVVNILPDPKNIPSLGLTDFAKAMPDQYKTYPAVEAYRKYYANDKASIATWKNRPTPNWFKDLTSTLNPSIIME